MGTVATRQCIARISQFSTLQKYFRHIFISERKRFVVHENYSGKPSGEHYTSYIKPEG